jgi:hypothetical protein
MSLTVTQFAQTFAFFRPRGRVTAQAAIGVLFTFRNPEED